MQSKGGLLQPHPLDGASPPRSLLRHWLFRHCLMLLGSAVLLSACQQGEVQPSAQLTPQHQTEPAENDRQAGAKKQAELKIAQEVLNRGWSAGHRATVACLQGERAQTDGDELRCEEESYVAKNYR